MNTPIQTNRTPLIACLTRALAWLGLVAGLGALAQGTVISSFSQNGELVCTNLAPGSRATVQWASAVDGPWTNSWAGLGAVTADSNGVLRVSVPMFYRVREFESPTNMVLIPADGFMMGDTFNDSDDSWGERPVHSVYVSEFFMDKYEVAKALWDEVRVWANTNGYDLGTIGSGKATNHPVHTVNWYEVVKWCNARSEREGLVPAYYTDAAQTGVYRSGLVNVQNDWVKWNTGYRLPTEAEWEKAARGGANGKRFPWSYSDTILHGRANYNASPSSYAYDVNPTGGHHPTFVTGGTPYTSPVGYFDANGYGLYDMAGNVWEWCWDWYASSYYGSSPTNDPKGPTSGSDRVVRGGGWGISAIGCRTAHRYAYSSPDYRANSLGFRCVRAAGQ